MGVAILSGVLASMDAKDSFVPQVKWESHTSGTVTPQSLEDESLPSRFLACVAREETGRRLNTTFLGVGGRRRTVEVIVGRNVEAVREASVVLLWSVSCPLFSSHPCRVPI